MSFENNSSRDIYICILAIVLSFDKREIGVQQAGKYPYFISLFNIGPYDCEKKVGQKIEESQNL